MSSKRKAAITKNEKLDFLMLCIKHSTTRLTIDFEAVKDELPDCNTKDTASVFSLSHFLCKLTNIADRYWRHFRLMKEYGLNSSGMPAGSGKNGASAPAKKAPAANTTLGGRVTKNRATPAANGETKKRSRKQGVTVNDKDNEGDVKAEAEDEDGIELVVKREPDAEEQLAEDLARAAESADDDDGTMEGDEGDAI